MDYKKRAAEVKADSFKMAALPRKIRDQALKAIISELSSHKEEIFTANAHDLKTVSYTHLLHV